MADPLSSLIRYSYASSADGNSSAANEYPPLPASLGALDCPEPPKTRADGQPMKKRGPKPRNKPPLDRKQELARKAQRSHRERKALYVKALEQELLQLKNGMSFLSSGHKTLEDENQLLKGNVHILSSKHATLQEENQQLKHLLAQNGISWPVGGASGFVNDAISQSNPPVFYPPTLQPETSDMTTTPSLIIASTQSPLGEDEKCGIDFEQLGIDFVLNFEKPCLRHMRVNPEDDQLYGHALMASCSPGIYPESSPEMPYNPPNNAVSSHHTCTLSKSGFADLLERSERLNLDGEVTPVMAWHMILNHPRFSEFTVEDFEMVTKGLEGKVRCYGFGAVFEEFEVCDVIENVMSCKDSTSGSTSVTGIVQ